MVIPKSKTFFTNATPPSVGRPFSLTFGDHFAMSNQSLEPAFHRHLPGRILSREIREQALELFEQGLGHKSVAKRLLGDVNNETIGHANLKNRSERTESLKRK